VPSRSRAAFGRKGFRQNEETIKKIGEAETGGDPERHAEMSRAEKTADGRANDESHPERCAEHAEFLCALFGGRNVSDVGKRSGDVGSSDSGNEATNEKPAKIRRESHENVVEAKTEAGKQDHWTAAETIRPGSQERREDELHGGPSEAKPCSDRGGARNASCLELENQVWKNRSNDAEGKEIEKYGDDNEVIRGART